MRAVVVAAFALVVLSVPSGAAQDSGDDCLSMLTNPIYWAGLPLAETAEVLGCRQLEDGTWVDMTIGDTHRYRRQVRVDPAMQAQIEATRPHVLEDIRAMATDPRLTRLFVYDFTTQTVRYRGPGNTEQTIRLTGEPLAATPDWSFFGLIHNAYQEAALSYLLDPAHADLASYVAWTTNRRDSILLAIAANLPTSMGDGLKNHYGYALIPWPWQLTDPYAIDAFHAWLITMDPVPPADAPMPGSGSSDVPDVPRLMISIVDEEGRPLTGACVRVSWAQGHIQSCDDDIADLYDAVGAIHIGVPPGTYTVQITASPSGYAPLVEAQAATVTSGNVSVVFTFRREHEQIA